MFWCYECKCVLILVCEVVCQTTFDSFQPPVLILSNLAYREIGNTAARAGKALPLRVGQFARKRRGLLAWSRSHCRARVDGSSHPSRARARKFQVPVVAKPKALTGAAVHGGVRPARLCGSPATANGKLLAVMRSSQLMTIMLLYRHTSDHAHARGPSRVRVRPSGAPALQGPHPTARCSPPSAAREE